MSQTRISKLEVEVEIKSQASKAYDVWLKKDYLLPRICPGKLKNVELVAGDWDKVGSVKLWTFVPGISEKAKEEVVAVDEVNKSITFQVLQGEILNYYNSMKSTVQVRAKENGNGSLVKWTLEYEKSDPTIPDPHKYLEFVADVAKAVDSYLLGA